jgi:CubicO group peptidase (beta-lactamase class C family)
MPPAQRSAEPSAERTADALAWLHDWQRSRGVPGLAWVVSTPTETVHVELSGLADRDGMRPVATDQRWQIGSISKAFTSIAVLQLQRRGLLTVDDPVIAHLPWVTHLDPGVTLHHLMTHTAGLPNGSEWTPDSLLESARQGVVGSPQPPGSPFWYSNPGYELLGDVVEAVTGQLLEAYLEAQVLRPLGMLDSSAAVVTADVGVDVRGHRPPQDDVLWRGQAEQTPDTPFPTCTADGAIAATPSDMGHYLRLLLTGGAEGVLPADDFALLAGRHVRDGDGWYGYGLRTAEHEGQVTLGHGGGMVGMFADVLVDRECSLGSCLLVNGYCDVDEANAVLMRRLCDLPWDEPAWPRPEPVTDDDTDLHAAFVGLYRSYNPWAPTFRVVRSAGELRLASPVTGSYEVLHPESPNRFRVGRADSPDVATFGVEVAGRCQLLELSGSLYGRARRDPAGGV